MIITFDPFFQRVAADQLQVTYRSSGMQLQEADFLNVTGIVTRLGVNLNRALLERFSQLKFVASITTGLDHIDLDYCQKRQLAVISLKGEVEFLRQIHATAEHTWALLLSLIRQVPVAALSSAKGDWQRERFFGTELYGKTIGILGCGRVGRMVLDYALAFGMRPLIFDQKKVEEGLKQYQSTLEAVLNNSDIITVHLPLESTTLGWVNQELFHKMKRGAILINTARGAIIDSGDLLTALQSGQIQAAALDVLEGETQFKASANHHLLLQWSANHPERLIITPHIAGSTHESLALTAQFILSKVLEYSDGRSNDR